MLEKLKEEVCKANVTLGNSGLVLFTWGNVSGIDREKGLIVIKPSGVGYSVMMPDDMVVVDLNGNKVEGELNPSSDLPTHLELYKRYGNLGGITHTHSTFATAWAQSGRDIPFYGTTHADYFYGDIPCTRALIDSEIQSDYEKNTGLVIIERIGDVNPVELPAVLVKSHGVFAFGKTPAESVYHATVLEECAKMAYLSENLNPDLGRADEALLRKHYLRKHGKNAYYGQKTRSEKD